MADAASSLDTPQGTPPKSFLSRLVGVFIEPGETFDDIARKPDWIPPLVVLILFSFATVETMLMKIGASQIVMQGLERSGRAATMDPAQVSQIVERSAGIMRIVMPAGALLGAPIFLLIVAGVGLLFLNVFFGQHAKFKDVFSVTCYANLPSILGALMAIALVLFGDAEAFNPQAPAPTNPGFFMNPLATSKAVFALASSLDALVFWFMALLAIGLSRVVQKKVKTATIFLAYLGVWVLLVAVKVGAALIFS
ncbi:MAG TPA: YIP1 family protein [Terriglobia bacterium]|nr:YIP1 family protein [Terriglobia bacterium]